MTKGKFLLAAGLLAGAAVFGVAAPAQAHTPAITVTCDGVVLHATNYDPNALNKWTVSLDGVVQSGTFGASLDKVIPVPQDGKTTTVGAQITDVNETPAYSQAFAGPVGPCGTPPVVVPPVVTPPVVTPPVVVVTPEEPELAYTATEPNWALLGVAGGLFGAAAAFMYFKPRLKARHRA